MLGMFGKLTSRLLEDRFWEREMTGSVKGLEWGQTRHSLQQSSAAQCGGSGALRRQEAWRKGWVEDKELTKEDRQQGKAGRDMKSKENAEESKRNPRSL